MLMKFRMGNLPFFFPGQNAIITDQLNILKTLYGKIILIIQQLCSRVRRLDNLYLEACSTIDEYREAEKRNIPASPSLLARLLKFSAVAKRRGL